MHAHIVRIPRKQMHSIISNIWGESGLYYIVEIPYGAYISLTLRRFLSRAVVGQIQALVKLFGQWSVE